MKADHTPEMGPDASSSAMTFRTDALVLLFLPPLIAMVAAAVLWPIVTMLSGLDVTWAGVAATAGDCGIGVLLVNAGAAWRKGRYSAWLACPLLASK
jgi:hypothetical protein